MADDHCKKGDAASCGVPFFAPKQPQAETERRQAGGKPDLGGTPHIPGSASGRSRGERSSISSSAQSLFLSSQAQYTPLIKSVRVLVLEAAPDKLVRKD